MKDPAFATGKRVAHAIRLAIKGAKAGRHWETLVGYSLKDLMAHLERQFLSGMSWANMDAWHIDHILPQAMFTYSSHEDPDFKACWALTNLRPLWSNDNLRKHDKRVLLI